MVLINFPLRFDDYYSYITAVHNDLTESSLRGTVIVICVIVVPKTSVKLTPVVTDVSTMSILGGMAFSMV